MIVIHFTCAECMRSIGEVGIIPKPDEVVASHISMKAPICQTCRERLIAQAYGEGLDDANEVAGELGEFVTE